MVEIPMDLGSERSITITNIQFSKIEIIMKVSLQELSISKIYFAKLL
jgi:hypothetical protein